MENLSEFFKIFSDPTRLKILMELLNGELCVSDISSKINMSPSAVSHQLMYLRQTKAVKKRKDGNVIYYRIADSHIETIIKYGLEHISEEK